MERNLPSRPISRVHPSALMIKILLSELHSSPESFPTSSVLSSLAENASELSQKPHSLSTYGRRSLKLQIAPSSEPCAICKDEVSENACCLPCEHFFHPLCVEEWFISHSTCPICRKNIDYY